MSQFPSLVTFIFGVDVDIISSFSSTNSLTIKDSTTKGSTASFTSSVGIFESKFVSSFSTIVWIGSISSLILISVMSFVSVIQSSQAVLLSNVSLTKISSVSGFSGGVLPSLVHSLIGSSNVIGISCSIFSSTTSVGLEVSIMSTSCCCSFSVTTFSITFSVSLVKALAVTGVELSIVGIFVVFSSVSRSSSSLLLSFTRLSRDTVVSTSVSLSEPPNSPHSSSCSCSCSSSCSCSCVSSFSTFLGIKSFIVSDVSSFS